MRKLKRQMTTATRTSFVRLVCQTVETVFIDDRRILSKPKPNAQYARNLRVNYQRRRRRTVYASHQVNSQFTDRPSENCLDARRNNLVSNLPRELRFSDCSAFPHAVQSLA